MMQFSTVLTMNYAQSYSFVCFFEEYNEHDINNRKKETAGYKLQAIGLLYITFLIIPAPCCQPAFNTLWFPCNTNIPSMKNQPMMRHWVITLWENAEQVAFLLIPVFLRLLLSPVDQKP